MAAVLRVALTVAGGGRAAAAATAGLASWLVRVAPAGARGEVSVALVSDARMRALNQRFRRQDHATDVLSFPSADDGLRGRADAGRALGDVVIAAGVAARQAREAGHSLGTELRVLALHGLLHLIGFDHETDDGRMARVEARLRRKGGLPVSLVERTYRATASRAARPRRLRSARR